MAVLCVIPMQAVAGPEEEARDAMQSFFDRTAAIAMDESATPEQQRALLERELSRHLDYGALAAGALGPLADRFSRSQYAGLAVEYQRHLTYLLIRDMAALTTRPATVTEVAHDPETGRVRVRALGEEGKQTGPLRRNQIDLVVRKRYGSWLIGRIQLSGVDFGQNFRAQFSSLLAARGPDEVITQLRQRNDANEARNPFDSPGRRS